METFTQPKIIGYRQLNEAEVALMNEIKEEGARLQALCTRVSGYLDAEREAKFAAAEGTDDSSPESAEIRRFIGSHPGRWASIGATHFQEGLMALTRAVAQPTSF